MEASDSLRSSSRSNAGWKNLQCVCCSTCITYEKCHKMKNSSLVSEGILSKGDKRKIKDNNLCQRSDKIRRTCKSEIQRDKRCADPSETKRKEKWSTNHILGLETLGKRSFRNTNLTKGEIKQSDCSGLSKDLKVKKSIKVSSKEEKREVPKDDKFCERSEKIKTCTLKTQKDRRCTNESKTQPSARVLRVKSSTNKISVFGKFGCRDFESISLTEGKVNKPSDSVTSEDLKVKNGIQERGKKEKNKEPKNFKICEKSEEIKTCTFEIRKDRGCANKSKTKVSTRVLRGKGSTNKIDVFQRFGSQFQSFESTNLLETEVIKLSDSVFSEDLKIKSSIQARRKISKVKGKRPNNDKICEKSEEIKTCPLEIHKDPRCADKSKIKLNAGSSKEKCSKNKINIFKLFGNQSLESSNLNEDRVNQPVCTVPLGDLKLKNNSQIRTKKKKRKRTKDDELCKKLEKTITNYTLEVCKSRKGADKSKSKMKRLKPKVNCRRNKKRCIKDNGCINKKNYDKSLSRNFESTCLMNDGIFHLLPSVLLRDVKEPTNSISGSPEEGSAEPSVTEDIIFKKLSMSFLDTSFWQPMTSTGPDSQKELIKNYNTVKNILLESVNMISQNRNVCEMECESNIALNNECINIFSGESISHFDPSLINTSVRLESKEDKEIKSKEPSASVKFNLPFDGICGEKIGLTVEERNPFSDSCSSFDAINSTSDELSKNIPFLQNEQLNDFSAVLDHSDMPELSIMEKNSFDLKNIMNETCVDLHQNSCLGQTKAGCNNMDNKQNRIASRQDNKSAVNKSDDLNVNGYNKSITSIEKRDLISVDNISIGNHPSNFSYQHVKDQNSLTEQSRSDISPFTYTQSKKQNTDKCAQEQKHCETSMIISEKSSVNDNLVSKVLSPKKQNCQSMESNKNMENSQCKLTHPVAADFTTKSSNLNSVGFNDFYKFAPHYLLNERAKFSVLPWNKSSQDQECYFPSLKIKEEPESISAQIPLVPETCRKCRKSLHFDEPIVKKTCSSVDSNNPLQLNLFCSACKFLYPVVIRKDVLDMLTQFLHQYKNFTNDALLEEQNDGGDKMGDRIKIKEEIIENDLPCIDQVVTISRDDFFKMNETITSNCSEIDTVKQHIAQNMNNSVENPVVSDLPAILDQTENAFLSSYNANLNMNGSIQNPVGSSSNLDQIKNPAVTSHHELSFSPQEQVKIPSDIITDFDFDERKLKTDIWMKDSSTFICGKCLMSLMREEVAKHFYEKHKILKIKFNVSDSSS